MSSALFEPANEQEVPLELQHAHTVSPLEHRPESVAHQDHMRLCGDSQRELRKALYKSGTLFASQQRKSRYAFSMPWCQ